MHHLITGVANAKTDKENHWLWMKRSDLETERKALTYTAQEQAFRITYVKCRIDNTADNDRRRMYRERGEMVWYILSECP